MFYCISVYPKIFFKQWYWYLSNPSLDGEDTSGSCHFCSTATIKRPFEFSNSHFQTYAVLHFQPIIFFLFRVTFIMVSHSKSSHFHRMAVHDINVPQTFMFQCKQCLSFLIQIGKHGFLQMLSSCVSQKPWLGWLMLSATSGNWPMDCFSNLLIKTK